VDGTGIGAQLSCQLPNQGSFAGPIGTNDGVNFSWHDRQVQRIGGQEGPEAFD
jgi:hypothetical protein